jgi:hypothetical protein
MADLKGELFDPRAGVTCAVALEWDAAAETLRIRGQGVDREVRGSSIAVATGGVQGRALFLTWLEGERGLAVGVTDRETVQALTGLISSALARELETAIAASLKPSRRQRLWLIIAGLIALLSIALFLLLGFILDAAQRF